MSGSGTASFQPQFDDLTMGSRKPTADSFEHSLKKLQAIVETLERGSISLDEAMKMYEEGVKISKQCLDQLSKAELTMKRLSKDLDGNAELTDGIEE